MVRETKIEDDSDHTTTTTTSTTINSSSKRRKFTSKSHSTDKGSPAPAKRRCVSTACIACRKRKSKVRRRSPSSAGTAVIARFYYSVRIG